MELLSPGNGVVLWQMAWGLHIILFIVSWLIILTTKTWDGFTKLAWMLGTILIPVLGAIVYFYSIRFWKRST